MPSTLTGFAFPFQIDPATGGVKTASDDAKLRANVVHLLLTNLGERVMRRGYGAGLRRLAQEPDGGALQAIVQHQVSKAISQLEPRVLLQGLSVSAADDGATLLVSVRYVIKRTQTVQSLSVPIPLGGL